MKKTALFLVLLSLLLAGSLPASSLVEEGKEAFEQNGCTGCHKIGSDWNGPDLSQVTTYRDKEWIVNFIVGTKKHYDDPVVKEMIKKFNLYMPEQGVEEKDAELIYEYLKSLPEAGKPKGK